MKIDWTSDGWRVLTDAATYSDPGPVLAVLKAQNISIPGPVTLFLEPNSPRNHGWLVIPDLTPEELAALNGDGDATDVSAANGSPPRS